MQVIHPAEGLISKAWNVGKPAPGNWRLLIYTFQTDCKGGTLLYNVITGELLLLSDAESKQLSSLPCSYEPWMDELIRKRFLVPEEAKDAETVAKLRTILRLIQRSTVLTGYTILPTMACNARCFYCYESGKEGYYVKTMKVGTQRSGTGDIFSSTFAGALMRGKTILEAASIAADFVVESIKKTIDDDSHWYGVKFEQALPMLVSELNK